MRLIVQNLLRNRNWVYFRDEIKFSIFFCLWNLKTLLQQILSKSIINTVLWANSIWTALPIIQMTICEGGGELKQEGLSMLAP